MFVANNCVHADKSVHPNYKSLKELCTYEQEGRCGGSVHPGDGGGFAGISSSWDWKKSVITGLGTKAVGNKSEILTVRVEQ